MGKRPVPKQLTPFKKGQSGNPSGRAKGHGEFTARLRDAFNVSHPIHKRTLTDVMLRHAFDDNSPNQIDCLKLCLAYGIGLPRRVLDDESVKALAKEMMDAAVEEARKRRAAADSAQLTVTATDNPVI